jgi:hypothetical protein
LSGSPESQNTYANEAAQENQCLKEILLQHGL